MALRFSYLFLCEQKKWLWLIRSGHLRSLTRASPIQMGDSHTYTNNYLMWIAYDPLFLYPSHHVHFISLSPLHTPHPRKPLNTPPHRNTSRLSIRTTLISSRTIHPSISPCYPHLPRFFSLDCIKIWEPLLYLVV